MKRKTIFLCSDCGYEAVKWSGQCPSCGAWNTLEEMAAPAAPKAHSGMGTAFTRSAPQKVSEVGGADELRLSTGISEFDRVLGGGAVAGSLILVGGEPGIGKSTLLLQACRNICAGERVLYVSGEESARQLKLRAQRVEALSDNLYIHAETDMDEVINAALKLKPTLMVIDSIQTIYRTSVESSPGSVSQIRDCTMALMQLAKSEGITIMVVGHVTKDGAIAGPKVLEHMVDCVLYFEGERNISYRMLRAAKNRFGSTNEIGVFEMSDAGLQEITNPSQALLSGRPEDAAGSCVACAMEGTRPILAEVQALVTKTVYGVPRRMAAGVDYNRAVLIMAILEKRAGLLLGASDAYLNVIGGLRLDEPAVDLPAALAIASSFLDRPVREGLVAFGEIGLTGELRAVSAVSQRLNEVRRLGFTKCVVPALCLKGVRVPDGLEVVAVKSLMDAIEQSL